MRPYLQTIDIQIPRHSVLPALPSCVHRPKAKVCGDLLAEIAALVVHDISTDNTEFNVSAMYTHSLFRFRCAVRTFGVG